MKANLRLTPQQLIPVLLIVAASCLRLFVCLQHNPMDYLWSDCLRHWENGLHFPKGGYLGAGDPIGYQVYMFVLHHITGDNRLLIGLASGLLSVIMPWTYYRAARDFGMSKTASLWVWVLIGWTPSLIAIFHFILTETLLLVLQGAALWMTARYLRKGTSGAFLVSVVMWTLAALTKPTVVPLAAVCVLWSWWKKSTPLRTIALSAVVAILLLVPQSVRSRHELGFIAPFGNPWVTRIMLRDGSTATKFLFVSPSGNTQGLVFASPSSGAQPLRPFSWWRIRRAITFDQTNVVIDAHYGERDWKKAYQSFRISRGEWLTQWGENVVLLLFSSSWPESQMTGQWDSRLDGTTRWIWAPLMVFLLVANLRDFFRRRFWFIPVAVTLFMLSFLLQNAVLIEGRYRKPLEPMLLMNLVWVFAAKPGERRDGTAEAEPDKNLRDASAA